MESEPLLDSPWPGDLDPATVPFKTRTQTVLRRAGLHDDPTRLDTLTEDDVMGWWNAGPATVADLRFAGNRAIRHHLDETDQRSEMNIALAGIAAEPWAAHVWHRDPRFSCYLPKGEDTVQQIAVSGHPDQRRGLSGATLTVCARLWPLRPLSASLKPSQDTCLRFRGSGAGASTCSSPAPG